MSHSPVLARICLMALLAPAAALALPPADPAMIAKAAAFAERQRANVDDVLGHAGEDGMALLVIPTVNLDAHPKRDFDDRDTRDAFARQRSMFMQWMNVGKREYGLTVGQDTRKFDPFDIGPLFQTPSGALTYQVIPVWPGEYRLGRITYFQPRAVVPEATGRLEKEAILKKVGVARMTETMDVDYEKTGPWPKHEKETDDGLGQGCEVVLRLGGGCDEAAREFRWQVIADRAVTAGAAEPSAVPSYDAVLTFAPIASISVKAGDVVLTDGFVLDGQPELDKRMCGGSGGTITCAMQSVTVKRLPASIESFRQAPTAASFKLPKLDAALRDLVYRAPTMLVEPADKASQNVIKAEME